MGAKLAFYSLGGGGGVIRCDAGVPLLLCGCIPLNS